jgi:hypothetical protein
VYLDNSLRGGVPIVLGEVDDDAHMRNADEDPRLKVYHVFSRIHGDLERDYNEFVIKSTFFSDVSTTSAKKRFGPDVTSWYVASQLVIIHVNTTGTRELSRCSTKSAQ